MKKEISRGVNRKKKEKRSSFLGRIGSVEHEGWSGNT